MASSLMRLLARRLGLSLLLMATGSALGRGRAPAVAKRAGPDP